MSTSPPTVRTAVRQLADACRREDADGNLLLAGTPPITRRLPWLRITGRFLGIAATWAALLVGVSFVLNQLLPITLDLDTVTGETTFFSVNLLLFNGLMIVAVLAWVRWVERRPIASLGLRGGRLLRRFVAGFGFGALSMGAVVVIALVAGQAELVDRPAMTSGASALPLLALLLIPWAVQASSEELVFQGWLLPTVARTYGLTAGVAVAAVVFAAVHLGNPGLEVLGVINLALYGVFAAAYALYQGSIAGIAGFHTAWNLTQAHVFGFAVSGGEVGEALPPVSLLTLEMTGPAWLVGSSFGPEAGLLTTLTIVVGLGVLLVLQRRRVAAAITAG